jgi:hypothetical protein
MYIYVAKNGSQVEDTYTAKVVTKVNEIVAGIKSPFFMRLEVDVSLLAHIYSSKHRYYEPFVCVCLLSSHSFHIQVLIHNQQSSLLLI